MTNTITKNDQDDGNSFLCVLQSDYDMVDYLNELRESCLEAYTGIVQGLKGDQENVHRWVYNQTYIVQGALSQMGCVFHSVAYL